LKSYHVNLWFRILTISLIVFYGVIRLLRHEITIAFFILILFCSFLTFLLLSFRIILQHHHLQVKCFYLKKTILREVPLEKIISIDADRVLFQYFFYLRLHPSIIRNKFYLGYDNVFVVTPLIDNRRDLIQTILEKNPSITIDNLTSEYITKNKNS